MTPDDYFPLISALSEPTYLVSKGQKILSANPAAAASVGVSLRGLIGKPFADLVTENAADLSRYVRSCLRSLQITPGCLSFIGPNGQATKFQCEGALIRPSQGCEKSIIMRCVEQRGVVDEFTTLNGKLAKLRAAHHQLLTDNRELERRVKERTSSLSAANENLEQGKAKIERALKNLKASEAFGKLIVANAAVGIVTTDLNGTIQVINDHAEQMFGYASGVLLGQQINVLIPQGEWQPPESSELSIAQHACTHGVEVSARCSDGTELPIALRLSELHMGELQSLTGILRDLTEERRDNARIRDLHEKLVSTSRQAGMAEVATGILHNVGNVLNNVTVSVSVCSTQLQGSKLPRLRQAVELLQAHAEDLPQFLTNEPAGRKLIPYLGKLTTVLEDEQATLVKEFSFAVECIEHIRTIVAHQQSHAKATPTFEACSVAQLLDDAMVLVGRDFAGSGVEFLRGNEKLDAELFVDRHNILQILVNLLSNAKDAVQLNTIKQVRIEVSTEGNSHVRIRVRDNGSGIDTENMSKIFTHGFTTKHGGHGFGLHHASNAAKAMGGSIVCVSDGIGQGAEFTLTLPLQPPSETSRSSEANVLSTLNEPQSKFGAA